MAKLSKVSIPLLLLLLLLFLPLFITQTAAAAAAMIGRKVGGRTQVKNVRENKEVQDLGRYCVQEYNRQLQQHKANGSSSASAAKLLVFSHVLEAETQVVSGIKYYLKISASTRGGVGGAPKTFEAVVVVKPWLHSKELLNFAPSSPPPTSTK